MNVLSHLGRGVLVAAGAAATALALGVSSAGANEAQKPLDPKLRLELIKGARQYFSVEDDPFSGREAVRTALKRSVEAGGPDVLARMDLLRDLAYQGRPFLPDYRDRKWQKEEANTEVNEGKMAVSVGRGDKLRLAFSVPKKDHTETNLARVPRIEPFPTLISLIEAKDYTDKFPGEAVLARRYGAMKTLPNEWILFAPVAVRGNYLENGNVRTLFFLSQLKDFYQRYHVDFERIVLDGDTTTVTTVAAAHPFLLAGLVARRPVGGSEPVVDPDTLMNYANVPVFVLHCPVTEKSFRDGGHPDVTRGDEAALAEWLKARKRVTPRSFKWNVKTAQQVLPHWMWVEADLSQEKRTLEVEVLDTSTDPNTIKVEARGLLDMTLFLNDSIVDLSRDVRVVINGKEVEKRRYDRTLEVTFDRMPLKARESLNFSMLFPAMTTKLAVPPPAAPPAPAATPAPAAPTPPEDPAKKEQETKAQGWLERAKQFVADGNNEGAINVLEKLLKELGGTTVAAEAKEMLAGLKNGAAGADAPK